MSAVLERERFFKRAFLPPTAPVAIANSCLLASPPWTFEVSPDEAFARIKGVIKSDEAYVISELDEEGRYLRASIRRFAGEDEVEFLVKGDDKVVLFKSTARKNGSVSDFGTPVLFVGEGFTNFYMIVFSSAGRLALAQEPTERGSMTYAGKAPCLI